MIATKHHWIQGFYLWSRCANCGDSKTTDWQARRPADQRLRDTGTSHRLVRDATVLADQFQLRMRASTVAGSDSDSRAHSSHGVRDDEMLATLDPSIGSDNSELADFAYRPVP